MESTIRFTNPATYQCKQLNLVTLPDGSVSSVSSDGSNTVLDIKDQAILSLDIGKKDEDFILSIGYFSVVTSLSNLGNAVTIYLQFGYPHTISGFSFSFDPITNPGKNLEITKIGTNVEVKYDNTTISSASNIVGPLRYMEVHNSANDLYPTMQINDIVYTS